MRSDLAALFYLEYRQLVNRVREAMRRPGRAVLYVGAIGYFAVITIVRAHGHRAMPMQFVPEPYASAVMFTYLTLLGVMAYGAASGIVGAFSSTADARFLTGSKIAERTAIAWLQLRRSWTSVLRMLLSILLYALVFAGSGTVVGIGLAIIGGTIVATAVAIPMLKLRAAAGASTAQTLAGVITAAGVLPMVILFASLIMPTPAARALERLGAGIAFNALFDGKPIALAALFLFGVLMVALTYASASGLYPDLYAASIRALEFREKAKRGGGAAFTMEHAYEQRKAPAGLRRFFDALGGSWTIAWKEWIAFERSPSMQRIFYFGLIACAICGALFGTVSARSERPLVEAIGFASMAANMIVIFVAMGSAIGLAADLRKPMWWMGPEPLWKRLFAWAAGTSWRLAACICAGVIGWSLAMRVPAVALAGIPVSAAAVLHLRAVGLAIYAIFPSSIDQRGPLAMVRALLTYLLAVPPVIAAVFAFLLFHESIAAAVAAGILASVGETMALVAFAASRIDGRGASFAIEESL